LVALEVGIFFALITTDKLVLCVMHSTAVTTAAPRCFDCSSADLR